MYDNYNYPAGADNADAPWNEKEVPEQEFQVNCLQTLVRETTVRTKNYMPYKVREFQDGENVCETGLDTSGVDWGKEYHNDNHLTPLQLITLFKANLEHLVNDMESLPKPSRKLRKGISFFRLLIKECEGWVEVETEFSEA